jgi:hypothetical protein
MEPENLLLHVQEPATWSYTEPCDLMHTLLSYFFKIRFHIAHLFVLGSSKQSLPLGLPTKIMLWIL